MNILFIIDGFFPYGNAFASRAISFCRLFNSIGYKVHVISSRTKQLGIAANTTYTLDCCSYSIASIKSATILSSFLRNKDLQEASKNALESSHYDAVFAKVSPQEFGPLLALCNKKHTPLYLEQCEWRDFSNFKLSRIDPRYLLESHCIKKEYPKADGIVAISRLLKNHFLEHMQNVVRIPTILDVQNTQYSLNTKNKKVILVYTGNPGVSKEFLAPIIAAIASSNELQRKIEFHIYGPSRDRVLMNIENNIKLLEKAGSSVVIHGNVPQEEINQILEYADYQIFLRPIRQSSNAGFPTKLGESMAVGTPVIANDTGDIGLYLHSGVNGFLLEDSSMSAVTHVLEQVIRLNQETYCELRLNARKTAENVFDYRVYTDDIRELFNK